MVDIVLKLTKEEITVTTDNNIALCVLYRIYAPSTSKITSKDSLGNIIGSMTIPSGFVEIMEKRATDTLSATVGVLCTPIAYK